MRKGDGDRLGRPGPSIQALRGIAIEGAAGCELDGAGGWSDTKRSELPGVGWGLMMMEPSFFELRTMVRGRTGPHPRPRSAPGPHAHEAWEPAWSCRSTAPRIAPSTSTPTQLSSNTFYHPLTTPDILHCPPRHYPPDRQLPPLPSLRPRPAGLSPWV